MSVGEASWINGSGDAVVHIFPNTPVKTAIWEF